jgi:hypothetical protein
VLWLAGAPVFAEEIGYLRGYVDALLDSRFPGYGLAVRTVAADGAVTIGARICLGPSQKRDIERLLARTGRVPAVAWDASAECRDESESEAPELPQIDIRGLPEEELFAPLIADPRQARFSMSYQWYETSTDDFNAASVAFGEYFGLAAGFIRGYGASQVGIQGAVFALFNLDAPSSDLVNADYWIGVPVSYRRGPWSSRVRLYHQSSHLGDEFLLGNPGINRVNLSYEALDGLLSYEWERVRVYGGGGYIFHSEPDLEPWQAQLGVEYVHPRAAGALDLIAAADIKAAEELDWQRSRAYQLGLELKRTTARRVRLMLEHFRGHSPNGQFYQERLRYTGIGLYFGF